MKKISLAIIAVILMVVALIVLNITMNNKIREGELLRESIYKFLINKSNRIKVHNSAAALNNNTTSNACVYFVSEVLRNNKYHIDESTCNTNQLISILKNKGWKKDNDYKNLKPGDICFTTGDDGDSDTDPTHTYVFMGWVKEGNYDYAYICDNQAGDYANKIYHKRNIRQSIKVNGNIKDAFSFYMRLS